MFTPQEVQEKTFNKAVFGGYDMQTVDEFLEPLSEDYITLYKENAVLKSKMKVLVEKLEEYRNQEQGMRKAMISAQKTAENMIADAERKAAAIINNAAAQAPVPAPAPIVPAPAPAPAPEPEYIPSFAKAEQAEREERMRIECARETAKNFISVLEQDIRSHLELLENLKSRDMAPELAEAAPVKPARPKIQRPKVEVQLKPFDFDEEDDDFGPAPAPAPAAVPDPEPVAVPDPEPVAAPEPAPVVKKPSFVDDPADRNSFYQAPVDFRQDSPEDIASEIEQNISKLMDLDDPVQDPPAKTNRTESATIKFTNLQFGRNYDPTSGK